MWLNQMQEALVNAAVRQGKGKLFTKIAKAADHIKARDPRPDIKLSYRTAQKLKSEGVIAR